MKVRDESHRYGITCHRALRRKKTFWSELDGVDGIGPARKKNLLRVMGSLKRVKEASVDQLAEVPGIGPELAQSIHDKLNCPS